MKEAIRITKYEIKWHEENRGDGPSSSWEKAFITGLKHLLELFEQEPNEEAGVDETTKENERLSAELKAKVDALVEKTKEDEEGGMRDINGVPTEEYKGPTFSINLHGHDGDIHSNGIFLHYGHAIIRVATSLRGFKAHANHITEMIDEIAENLEQPK